MVWVWCLLATAAGLFAWLAAAPRSAWRRFYVWQHGREPGDPDRDLMHVYRTVGAFGLLLVVVLGAAVEHQIQAVQERRQVEEQWRQDQRYRECLNDAPEDIAEAWCRGFSPSPSPSDHPD